MPGIVGGVKGIYSIPLNIIFGSGVFTQMDIGIGIDFADILQQEFILGRAGEFPRMLCSDFF